MTIYCIQEVHNEAQPHDCIGGIEVYGTQEKRDEELAKKKPDEYYDYYGFELEISGPELVST